MDRVLNVYYNPPADPAEEKIVVSYDYGMPCRVSISNADKGNLKS